MALTKTQERALKLLLKRVRLETACFSFSTAQRKAIAERPCNTREGDIEEIREVTRLYRQTWVEPIIEALLDGDTQRLREMVD